MRILAEILAAFSLVGFLAVVDSLGSGIKNGLIGSSTSSREAAERLIAYSEEYLPPCYADVSGPHSMLVKAIGAIENASQSGAEEYFETALLWIAKNTGTPPIDFSYGPMQIRPSTIKKWISNVPNKNWAVASLLLDKCSNIKIGQQLIAEISKSVGKCEGRVCTTRILEKYNGQKEPTVSSLIYLEIVQEMVALQTLANQSAH